MSVSGSYSYAGHARHTRPDTPAALMDDAGLLHEAMGILFDRFGTGTYDETAQQARKAAQALISRARHPSRMPPPQPPAVLAQGRPEGTVTRLPDEGGRARYLVTGPLTDAPDPKAIGQVLGFRSLHDPDLPGPLGFETGERPRSAEQADWDESRD